MINGILNVYKEKGYTSHDVVARLRGICRQKKIGHTGTLDPDAEGVLPVCLGSATKLCDMLTDRSKEYRAEFLLGVTTDTQDISGTVLKERQVGVTKGQVEEAARSFLGPYQQIPPMYSALKVNGQRLYTLARQGKEIERKARPVFIDAITILESELPHVTLQVACSKGTYIRTLGYDMGEKLGCGAVMTSLLRTRAGEFGAEDALTLAQIEVLQNAGEIAHVVKTPEMVFTALPQFFVRKEFRRLIDNGNTLFPEQLTEKGPFTEKQQIRIYNDEEQFCAVYEYREEGYLRAVKMFKE